MASGDVLCVIPGPTHEYARRPAGVKWCFGCRKRLPHDDVCWGDPPEVMSYYDPQWFYECPGCKKDRTRFPESLW